MRPTRGSVLAGLVFVAAAAPVAAFAVASGDDGDQPVSKSAHARSHDKGEKADDAAGAEHADAASAPGRAHAAAMKAWARCVADAASGQKSATPAGPPKDACGDKPVGPGRAKHAGDGAPGRSGDHRPASPGQGHGRGHGHGHS